MGKEADNRLAEMLGDGWIIEGYSVCLMAMGATSHHTLLRKGTDLKTATIVMNGGEEVGRDISTLSPAPTPKKGWFG